jgi:hypothetical protein
VSTCSAQKALLVGFMVSLVGGGGNQGRLVTSQPLPSCPLSALGARGSACPHALSVLSICRSQDAVLLYPELITESGSLEALLCFLPR